MHPNSSCIDLPIRLETQELFSPHAKESRHARRLVGPIVEYIRVLGTDWLLESQPENKEGFVEKLFHHENHKKDKKYQGQEGAQGQAPQRKEGEVDKLEAEIKDYLKEDEKLQEEGKEYGGLM